ncbi:MAG TPA: hypothetical protein PKJ92_10545 [Accumulibacter sp.]|nr:hypothetical protein [Accumulibacter sp.]
MSHQHPPPRLKPLTHFCTPFELTNLASPDRTTNVIFIFAGNVDRSGRAKVAAVHRLEGATPTQDIFPSAVLRIREERLELSDGNEASG